MIRPSEKNSNKKNQTPLREKIITLVAKHPRYRLDLYNTCGHGHLTRSKFYQLLDEMQADGEIHINANNLVKLPIHLSETKPPPTDKETHTEKPTELPDETLIHCLVNRSRTLKHPKQKKSLNNHYYAHDNYTIEEIPLNSVGEETLLKGHQLVPGEFRPNANPKIGIRTAENWHSQRFFLIEFDDTTENTLDEFIAARPFLQENAWLLTESLRSRYDDPDDPKCNGQLRLRVALCMPRAVNTLQERQWVYDALEKEMPDCDNGSANSITNGGQGNANAAHIKIGKIVDTDWFNSAIQAGRKAEKEKQQAEERAAEARKRKQAERAAIGFTEREGELPLEALAKSDPSLFLESLSLSEKSKSGKYQHWGQT